VSAQQICLVFIENKLQIIDQMKAVTFILLFVLPGLILAQTKVVRYFDESWEPTQQQKSTYVAEFVKDNDNYTCIFYWAGSTKMAGKGVYADTTLAKPIGLVTSYYKNGITEDSTYYDDKGSLQYSFHYYKTGKLEVHHYVQEKSNESKTEAYDENGKKIKNYIYAKEAEFKGGERAWKNYIAKNVNTEFKSKGKEEEIVAVRILFAVNETGNTANIKVIESSGNKQIDNDAIRVIQASPIWNNAIYLNKPIKVYRIQPISYVLSPSQKN